MDNCPGEWTMISHKPRYTLKGQVSAFIIIGIIIVALVWTAVWLSGYLQEGTIAGELSPEQEMELQSTRIKQHIDICVATVTDEGIQKIASQGLYLDPAEGTAYNDTAAYWLKDTVNKMPDNLAIASEDLKVYVSQNLPSCVDF